MRWFSHNFFTLLPRQLRESEEATTHKRDPATVAKPELADVAGRDIDVDETEQPGEEQNGWLVSQI